MRRRDVEKKQQKFGHSFFLVELAAQRVLIPESDRSLGCMGMGHLINRSALPSPGETSGSPRQTKTLEVPHQDTIIRAEC
jgi:hypothetical protein